MNNNYSVHIYLNPENEFMRQIFGISGLSEDTSRSLYDMIDEKFQMSSHNECKRLVVWLICDDLITDRKTIFINSLPLSKSQ
jgi:hypothetical protein